MIEPRRLFVDIIAGARPNFVKIASLIHAIENLRDTDKFVPYRLVHTGQHYDVSMSGNFFEQLGIPDPDLILGASGSGPIEQTADIMARYAAALEKERPALTIVVGDVNSTVACAFAAQRLGVPVAHIEAGIRSFDWGMPEEINRIVTDSISNWYFTTSTSAGDNLRLAGAGDDRIFFVGNTMIDTLLANISRLARPQIWGTKNLISSEYILLTLHRPTNVDSSEVLDRLLNEVCRVAEGRTVIFPVHPRTQTILQRINNRPPNLLETPPQPYLEFIYLVKNALGVVTDSGGVTEEATMLGIPCITLRNSTERPETVTIGTNELVGDDLSSLGRLMADLLKGHWKQGGIPEKWDGRAGERIALELRRILTEIGSSL